MNDVPTWISPHASTNAEIFAESVAVAAAFTVIVVPLIERITASNVAAPDAQETVSTLSALTRIEAWNSLPPPVTSAARITVGVPNVLVVRLYTTPYRCPAAASVPKMISRPDPRSPLAARRLSYVKYFKRAVARLALTPINPACPTVHVPAAVELSTSEI